jgi:hypothetical protein
MMDLMSDISPTSVLELKNSSRLLRKESLNSDGQQFHQYQQNQL